MPEHLKIESIKPILSAGKAPRKEGKGYEGKHTNLPFTGCAMSNGRKELIGWLREKECMISYF